MVRKTGPRSNLQSMVESLVEALMDQPARQMRCRLLRSISEAEKRPVPARVELRLPLGRIQSTVVAVLRGAPKPMRARQVHAEVEQLLGRAVSRDTVNSCLTIGARDPMRPINRVGRDLYEVRSMEP